MRNDFETGYLMHWGIKKGGKKQNHKYYERVEKNGKYLYFYTQAEYEAWLNKGNKTLDNTKNKAKNALSSLKNKLFNTKKSLINAVNKGGTTTKQLISKSSTRLNKSNVSQFIDKGNKTISSLLNKTSRQVSNTTANLKKSSKTVSGQVSKKTNSIVNKVKNTLKKAGKDTTKAVQTYISKGEKTIKSVLSKAGNVKLGSGTAKYEKKASGILTSLLTTVAVTALYVAARYVAPKVVKKAKELIDKIFNPETTISITTDTRPKDRPKEPPPKDFSSDSKDSYKEDRAQHSDIPQKDAPTNRDDDMKAINPNYISEEDRKRQEALIEEYYKAITKGDQAAAERIYDEYMAIEDKYAGYVNNCVNCTLAYDLRRRGYDVDAPWNPNGTYVSSLFDWYDIEPEDFVGYNASIDGGHYGAITKNEAKQLKKALEKEYPEGSYGHLNLSWDSGNGGHDCVWSIENGEVIIRDCQTNKVVPFEEYATKANEIIVIRTDDKKLKDAAYEVAVADKANSYGREDTDDYQDDDEVRDYDLFVENNQEKIKTKQDQDYDKYWRTAAGKKRK